jgi:hypothetical protein
MQHCSHAKDFFSIFKKKAWVPWCRYKMANIFVPIQLSILFQLLLKKKVVATIIPNPPSIFKFIMSFNLFSFWLCMQYLLLDVNKQTINTLWKIGDVILMIRIMRVSYMSKCLLYHFINKNIFSMNSLIVVLTKNENWFNDYVVNLWPFMLSIDLNSHDHTPEHHVQLQVILCFDENKIMSPKFG